MVALDYGEKIAEGTYEEVASNQRVIEAYLGKSAEAGEDDRHERRPADSRAAQRQGLVRPVRVLEDMSLEVFPGEIVCLLGSNAAGKTTTLRTILGMVRPSAGEILLEGERIDGLTTPEIVAKRLTMVPENRRLFAKMSVLENLEIGANLRRDEKDEIRG